MMSRFILLDHSIKRIGGHHFEYALQLLNAAAATGLYPRYGHKSPFFRARPHPSSWHLYPLYTHTVYEVSVWLQQLRQVRSTSDNTSTTTPLPCEFYQSPRITSNWRAALWNAITKPWQLWQAQYAESQYQLYSTVLPPRLNNSVNSYKSPVVIKFCSPPSTKRVACLGRLPEK